MIRFRTVLDTRSKRPAKFFYQTTLLAASWKTHASGAGPLEIFVIGDLPEMMVSLFGRLGAKTVKAASHSLVNDCPFANKLAALQTPWNENERVLLLDNDTCWLAKPDPLMQSDPRIVAAAEAGADRVPTAAWDELKNRAGLSPFPETWIPWTEQFQAIQEGRQARAKSFRMANAGVALIGHPDFGKKWEESLERSVHTLRSSPELAENDGIAFTAAAANWPEFKWLSPVWNYRPPCFWLDLNEPASLRIIHMTDMRHVESSLSATLDRYWQERVIGPIQRDSRGEPGLRLENALSALQRVQTLLKDHGLESFGL